MNDIWDLDERKCESCGCVFYKDDMYKKDVEGVSKWYCEDC